MTFVLLVIVILLSINFIPTFVITSNDVTTMCARSSFRAAVADCCISYFV